MPPCPCRDREFYQDSVILLPQQLSSKKLYGREFPEAAWQKINFRDASTCANPGVAGSRAALSMTSLKYFSNT
jgi:hypothetical protein